MLRVADWSSPSLSVMVAVSLTRLSAASVVDWSGPLSGVCTTARFWSSVTLPAASTLTVNTRSSLVSVRPSTTRTVERQVDRLIGRGVDQTRGTRNHAQRVGQRARPVGAEGRAEVGGEAGAAVGREDGFVDGQRRLHAGRRNARTVIVKVDEGADLFGVGVGGFRQKWTSVMSSPSFESTPVTVSRSIGLLVVTSTVVMLSSPVMVTVPVPSPLTVTSTFPVT